MSEERNGVVRLLINMASRRPWVILTIVSIATAVSLMLASKLEMRTNWTDILPDSNSVVQSYREVQARFGDSGGIVVALEGNYERITTLADKLAPQLSTLQSLSNVQAKSPTEFIRQHGFVLMKPKDFERMLRIYEDQSLVGVLRGFSNDLENEYTDNESNLRNDEVDVARSILGLHTALESLGMAIGEGDAQNQTSKAVDAMTLGEPWMVSLDRQMLLIQCEPVANQLELDAGLATVADVREIVEKTAKEFPDVDANLTGIYKIMEDEMNSVGGYTVILSLLALLLIYIILARSFRGFTVPIIALIPLLIGILWTMALLYLAFGGLNLFTAMIMIVLLGLGIDFSIHLISRFYEELNSGQDLDSALQAMLGDTGKAVLTGGLTSSAAFFALLIGESKGVFEFGLAAGGGVLLTLLAVYLTLPAMLVTNHRRQTKKSGDLNKVATINAEMPVIGRIATVSFNRSAIFILIALILSGFSLYVKSRIEFEYDFMNLEPAGLKSIQLQRSIPDKFGMSDHSAWLVTDTIEESRQLKEDLKNKSSVGDVYAISDYILPDERFKDYASQLDVFTSQIEAHQTGTSTRADEVVVELNRLWDNLDLMSNLAFTGGLDRIVKVIDNITGTDSETGEVDITATLPKLINLLETNIDQEKLDSIGVIWHSRMKDNLIAMANYEPFGIEDLPASIRKSLLPREGEGFLMHIFPRSYLFNKEDLDRFTEQTSSVSDEIAGTERLITVMFDQILEDGKNSAWLAIGIIIVLVLIQFRHPIGLLSLLPLTEGALLMVGLMYLLGEKYNYMNLIAVPIILGIGIDDGIHALHRYLNEKGDRLARINKSFSTVGRAILLTSITTMIGFGSVAFYTMEGMASFGRALFMGVGACFIATIFILPASIKMFTRNR